MLSRRRSSVRRHQFCKRLDAACFKQPAPFLCARIGVRWHRSVALSVRRLSIRLPNWNKESIVEFALFGLSSLFGIAALFFVLIVIKMFQNNQTGLGLDRSLVILMRYRIYPHADFRLENKNAWGLQTVMPIYTVSLILSIVLGGAGYAILIPKFAAQIQQEMERQKSTMPNNLGQRVQTRSPHSLSFGC